MLRAKNIFPIRALISGLAYSMEDRSIKATESILTIQPGSFQEKEKMYKNPCPISPPNNVANPSKRKYILK
jgi:hypothetical protein